MHILDGYIDVPVSVGAGLAAVAGLACALRRSQDALEERQAPLTGLVASFIFAVQMLNFPVAAGTSGHLLGGALAGILVGPHAGAVCVAVVLLVQGLLFADGGLSAYGLNVINMALIPAYAGYGLFALLRRVLPSTSEGAVIASGVAAGVSVVLAAAGFALEYALGGTGSVGAGLVARAMLGVHVPIGIGEGAITALTVATVLGTRPDLVYGAGYLRAAPAQRQAVRA